MKFLTKLCSLRHLKLQFSDRKELTDEELFSVQISLLFCMQLRNKPRSNQPRLVLMPADWMTIFFLLLAEPAVLLEGRTDHDEAVFQFQKSRTTGTGSIKAESLKVSELNFSQVTFWASKFFKYWLDRVIFFIWLDLLLLESDI